MASTNRIVIGIRNELLFSDESGLVLTRVAFGESENIGSRVNVHGRLRSPQDNLNPLEIIDFNCIRQQLTDADAVLDLIEENYGKVFIVRSYIHNRIFRGFIDEQGKTHSLEQDNCVDINFTMTAKDSFVL